MYELELIHTEDTSEELMKILKDNLSTILGINVFLSKEILQTPEEAYDGAREQYKAEAFLSGLKDLPRAGAVKLLGVTSLDLYTPSLNFVFGMAEKPGKTAIISLKRLKQDFYGREPDKRLLSDRAIKEAVHEVGHVFDLDHCRDRKCVMAFSNAISDTDRKQAQYCDRCRSIFDNNAREEVTP